MKLDEVLTWPNKMKVPKNFVLPYCDICDEYSHDISHCVEFRAVVKDFKDRGIKAVTKRFEESDSIEQFNAKEEAIFDLAK